MIRKNNYRNNNLSWYKNFQQFNKWVADLQLSKGVGFAMYKHLIISPKEILNSVLLSKYVYDDLSKLPPVDNLQIVSTFDNDNTEGAIYHDNNDNTIYISFRGTSEKKDILTDGAYFSKKFLDTKAHRGCVNAFYDVEHIVLDALNNFMKSEISYNIVLCGHSLGGALANLFMYYFNYTKCIKYKDIKSITAGSLKVFIKRNLTKTHDIFITNALRITHADDIVPSLPPDTLILTLMRQEYVHVGEHWSIGIEDDKHSFKEHKIKNYVNTLIKEGVLSEQEQIISSS